MRIPIAREGHPFILAALVLAVIAWFITPWLEILFGPLAVFVIAFFRDPERVIPSDENSIVSPADGRVIKVETVADDRILKKEVLRICVFMNVFNVHVNRAPASGVVTDVLYNPGKFFNASFDKASLLNEQNAVVMKAENGETFAFNQIAGLIARRIVCHARPAMRLSRGERFGLIRFGSRVDVYLPAGSKAAVRVGDKVRAGSSILGYWNVR